MVQGLLAAGLSDQSGPMNLGNPDEISLIELAETIASSLGIKAEFEYQSLPEDDPKRRCPDISLARSTLGWEPRVPLSEGIQKTTDWLRLQI
jgi:nucleoside-diphosphate-sugar epimerase